MELDVDLNIDTGGKVELLELIDGACGGINNVEEALVGADFELVGRLFVHVHRAVDGELFNPGGKRDGTSDPGSGALGGLDNLDSGAIDGAVIEGAEANADFLIHGEKGEFE